MNDKYRENIEKIARDIIDNKNYTELIFTLLCYDKMGKNVISANTAKDFTDSEYPFWDSKCWR